MTLWGLVWLLSSHMCPQAWGLQKGSMHKLFGSQDNCPMSQLSCRAIATEVMLTRLTVLTSAESPLYVQLWWMLGAQMH